jgi:Zn-dependent protease with chaperone function
MQVDPGFVTWCDQCDWNVRPSLKEEKLSHRKLRARRRAGERAERLFDQVTLEPELRPRWDGARVASYVAAAVVHLVTAFLLVSGLLVVLLAWGNWVGVVLGAIVLFLGIALRPRFGKLPKRGAVVFRRAAAPTLFGLLDDMAEQLGARAVDWVAVDRSWNASYGTVGVRRRRLVTLGMPLWTILEPEERLAILGHEMAHDVNGDSRRGMFVGTALQTLTVWYGVLKPRRDIWNQSLFASIIDLGMHGVAWVVLTVLHGFARISFRSTQRAEYLADEVAASTATTAAITSALDKLLLGHSALFALQRAQRNRSPDLWAFEATHIREMPARERERLRRVEVLEGYDQDHDHPPIHLRIKFLEQHPVLKPSIHCAPERWSAIERELAPGSAQVARWIVAAS